MFAFDRLDIDYSFFAALLRIYRDIDSIEFPAIK
jgi:hypothetical protein